ncbi:hypothetical protein [Lentzea sp. NPDC051838]|uniref:hypothetical protein n=1 Tax=Lentzea sp. NPDC051838 TaxID=3154849 RepID=UPI003427097F
MGKPKPMQVLKTEGPPAFAFLVEKYGFLGPELEDDGFTYHRPGMHISISSWWGKGETGFTTYVEVSGGEPYRRWHADLGCLYVACDLGPLQAVGLSTGSGHLMRKRIGEHSAALRKVMLRLDGPECFTLMERCHAKPLPD